VAELQAANDDFEKAYQHKVVIGGHTGPHRSGLSHQCAATYLDTNRTDNQGVSEEMITEFNEVIDEIMAKAHAHRSRKESAGTGVKKEGTANKS
jgi:hypothetical protein